MQHQIIEKLDITHRFAAGLFLDQEVEIVLPDDALHTAERFTTLRRRIQGRLASIEQGVFDEWRIFFA